MNNLENKEVLSNEYWTAIDAILKHCPEAIFGGSIALNAVGLINRKVSDIDLLFSWSSTLTGGLLNIDLLDIGSGQVIDENGREIQRTTASIGAVKCCVFKVSDESLAHCEMMINGRNMKIQNVNFAIIAKTKYAEKGIDKHIEDIKNINDSLLLF